MGWSSLLVSSPESVVTRLRPARLLANMSLSARSIRTSADRPPRRSAAKAPTATSSPEAHTHLSTGRGRWVTSGQRRLRHLPDVQVRESQLELPDIAHRGTDVAGGTGAQPIRC